ncbi:hypothetical protein C8R46DRAFT_1027883 [Mycena filopes]|nr:hypothetical protein C8R46DRAFT_1027883 [Mycena filopes]
MEHTKGSERTKAYPEPKKSDPNLNQILATVSVTRRSRGGILISRLLSNLNNPTKPARQRCTSIACANAWWGLDSGKHPKDSREHRASCGVKKTSTGIGWIGEDECGQSCVMQEELTRGDSQNGCAEDHCTFESAAVLDPRAVARRGSTAGRYRHEKINERHGFGARRVKNNTRARSCQCGDTVGISAGMRHELTVDDNPDGHCVEVEEGLQGTQRK